MSWLSNGRFSVSQVFDVVTARTAVWFLGVLLTGTGIAVMPAFRYAVPCVALSEQSFIFPSDDWRFACGGR